MYYAEKIIDGVLHWKGNPNDKWQPFTAEQLTEMLETARRDRRDGWDGRPMFERIFGRF